MFRSRCISRKVITLFFLLFQRSIGCVVILAATFSSIAVVHWLFCHTCCYHFFYSSVSLVALSYLLLPFLLFQRSIGCFVILAATIPSTVFQCSLDCLIILAANFPSISAFLWLPLHSLLFQRSLGCFVILAATFSSILVFPLLFCQSCCYLSFYYSVPFVVL